MAPRRSKLKSILIVYGTTAFGIALILTPFFTTWAVLIPAWGIGVPVTLLVGQHAVANLYALVRYRTREDRIAAVQRMTWPRNVDPAVRRGYAARQAWLRRDEVLPCGREGTAVVRVAEDTGIGRGYHGHERLVYLELSVTIGDAPAHQAVTGDYRTPTTTGWLAVGQRLAVRVHPDDPGQVAIDWTRTGRLPAVG